MYPKRLSYILHGWNVDINVDISGMVRLRQCFSPRARALRPSAAAFAALGRRAKGTLPTQATANARSHG